MISVNPPSGNKATIAPKTQNQTAVKKNSGASSANISAHEKASSGKPGNAAIKITQQPASAPLVGYKNDGKITQTPQILETLPAKLLEGVARLSRTHTATAKTSLYESWTNLARLIEQTSHTQETEKFLKNHLPNAKDSNFAPKITRYLAYLGNGKLGEILEKELGNLSQHSSDIKLLLKNVKKDAHNILSFSEKPIQDNVGQEWRLWLIPFYHDSHVNHLRLYTAWKRHKQQKQKKEEEKRFIVETLFSAFGPLQLDTMQHKKNIRILFRTHNALPEDWQKAIQRVFGETLAMIEASGDIFFQITKEFPISPEPPPNKEGFYI